ncbi:hypothetical protein LN474_11065, partial [Xanthomonas codiaei]|uniref:hypothetical protein n=1 Tax=Xanthomonas codiaei TaxID=56463 RepID=UPI001E32888D
AAPHSQLLSEKSSGINVIQRSGVAPERALSVILPTRVRAACAGVVGIHQVGPGAVVNPYSNHDATLSDV